MEAKEEFSKDTLDHVLRYCKDRGITIKDLQIEGERDDSGQNVYSAFISLQPNTEVPQKTPSIISTR